MLIQSNASILKNTVVSAQPLKFIGTEFYMDLLLESVSKVMFGKISETQNSTPTFGPLELFYLDSLGAIAANVLRPGPRSGSNGAVVANPAYQPGYVTASLYNLGDYWMNLIQFLTTIGSSTLGSRAIANQISMGVFNIARLQDMHATWMAAPNGPSLNSVAGVNAQAILFAGLWNHTSSLALVSGLASNLATPTAALRLLPTSPGAFASGTASNENSMLMQLFKLTDRKITDVEAGLLLSRRRAIEAAIFHLKEMLPLSAGEPGLYQILQRDILNLQSAYALYLLINNSSEMRQILFPELSKSVGSDLSLVSSLISRVGTISALFIKAATTSFTMDVAYASHRIKDTLHFLSLLKLDEYSNSVTKLKHNLNSTYDQMVGSWSDISPLKGNVGAAEAFQSSFKSIYEADHLLPDELLTVMVNPPSGADWNTYMSNFIMAPGTTATPYLFTPINLSTVGNFSAYNFGSIDASQMARTDFTTEQLLYAMNRILLPRLFGAIQHLTKLKHYFDAPTFKEAEVFGTTVYWQELFDWQLIAPAKTSPLRQHLTSITYNNPLHQHVSPFSMYKFEPNTPIPTPNIVPQSLPVFSLQSHIAKTPVDLIRLVIDRAVEDRHDQVCFSDSSSTSLVATTMLKFSNQLIPWCYNRGSTMNPVTMTISEYIHLLMMANSDSEISQHLSSSDIWTSVQIFFSLLNDENTRNHILNQLAGTLTIYDCQSTGQSFNFHNLGNSPDVDLQATLFQAIVRPEVDFIYGVANETFYRANALAPVRLGSPGTNSIVSPDNRWAVSFCDRYPSFPLSATFSGHWFTVFDRSFGIRLIPLPTDGMRLISTVIGRVDPYSSRANITDPMSAAYYRNLYTAVDETTSITQNYLATINVNYNRQNYNDVNQWFTPSRPSFMEIQAVFPQYILKDSVALRSLQNVMNDSLVEYYIGQDRYVEDWYSLTYFPIYGLFISPSIGEKLLDGNGWSEAEGANVIVIDKDPTLDLLALLHQKLTTSTNVGLSHDPTAAEGGNRITPTNAEVQEDLANLSETKNPAENERGETTNPANEASEDIINTL